MCLDDQILNTYIDGELTEPWKSQVEEHLSYCDSCRLHYESLKELRAIIKDSSLSDEEIKPHQDRVLAYLEKNCLSKKKKLNFFSKTFRFKPTQLLGAAAAFVIVFVGSWSLFSNRSESEIPLPDLNTSVDIANITPVRASDNAATSKTLDSYSLDDILKNLDARGYDIDIRLKSIQPVKFSSDSDDSVVLALTDGTYVTAEGTVYDSEGTILATGLSVTEDNKVVDSNGSVFFEAEQTEETVEEVVPQTVMAEPEAGVSEV